MRQANLRGQQYRPQTSVHVRKADYRGEWETEGKRGLAGGERAANRVRASEGPGNHQVPTGSYHKWGTRGPEKEVQ